MMMARVAGSSTTPPDHGYERGSRPGSRNEVRPAAYYPASTHTSRNAAARGGQVKLHGAATGTPGPVRSPEVMTEELMRLSIKDPGTTPWWAQRRTLGTALAVTLIVVTVAAARENTEGEGLLNLGGGGRTSSGATGMSTIGQNAQAAAAQGGMSTNTWTWNGSAYLWKGSVWAWQGSGANRFAFRTLTNRADPTFDQLLGIDDHGLIVGYDGSGADASHPNKGFRLTSPYGRTDVQAENFPGSVQTQAVAVNGTGTSAGFYVDATGANHGYVRRNGRFHRVDFPGTTSRPTFNQLLGINGPGIAVGFFNDAKGMSHGYLFDTRTGRFTLIRLPVAATSVVPTGINDHGQVVGFYQVGKITNGFLWGSGHLTVLRYGNHTDTQALGVNNLGVVVGSFVDAGGRTHGFVRMSGHLMRVVDAPGSTSTVVNGLNNRGQIVGFSTDLRKDTLGFLAHR